MSEPINTAAPVMCRHVDCTRPATHHLEFRAWAAGAPKIASTCIAGRIPQPLCKEHARSAQARDVITKRGFENIAKVLADRGHGMPDMDSILIVPVEGVPPIILAGLPASNTRH